MMRGSTTVFTVKNVMESLAYFRDKIGFDVADLDGNMIFFGMESKKTS
jgi:hypothetical protein